MSLAMDWYEQPATSQRNAMMYIAKNDVFVNLNNVSYIKFDDNKHKVIFSFNYNIQVDSIKDKAGQSRLIPDYVYADFDDKLDYAEFKDYVQTFVSEYKDFKIFKYNNVFYIINMECIATVKFKDERIILNFNSTTTYKNNKSENYQLTGYFLFIDCDQTVINTVRKNISDKRSNVLFDGSTL